MATLSTDQVDAYLQRIGLDPSEVRASDRDRFLLAELQTAHVHSVPFENLSIVGNPHTDATPDVGISLDIDALYEKIVLQERGGYCFELNGLFTTLLASLSFPVERAAAMMIPDDGDHSTPANHHVIRVALDRDYVVDVGMGSPQMRTPTPLDGTPTTPDDARVRWRVIETDRPQYRLRTQYQIGDQDWQDRYDFDPTPRPLSYFEATNDYLSNAPESVFVTNSIVRIDTATGWKELRPDTYTVIDRGEETEHEIDATDWQDLLSDEFDLTLPPDT